MKVLLHNPAVDFDRQFGSLKKFYTPIPSLGLAYIGAILRQDGFEVEGLDSFMECHTTEEMEERILASSPDVLGISLLTPSSPLVDRLLPELRKKLPELIIILGNIHGSVFHEYYLQNKFADFVVHHEGEATMLELLRALRDKNDTNQIEGISYLGPSGNIVKTPKRTWIHQLALDEMPYPAWDLFPVEQFKADIRMQGTLKFNDNSEIEALPILSSRGCPYNCSFCSPVNTIGRRYTMRSPKSVVDEMEYFFHKWGVNTFYYMDLIFPLTEKMGLEFCDELIARKLPIRWRCETRVSSVTPKLLERMKESGCYAVDYGIECGNQKMLDSINKQFTIRQVEEAVAATAKAGIESEGMFIIGLPGETAKDTWDAINFAVSLDLDHIKLNLFVPYPGSELWDVLKSRGELTNFDFNEYTSYSSYTKGVVPYVPKGRTHEELVKLQKIGMQKAFFRKKVVLRELRNFKWDKIDQYWTAVKEILFPPPTGVIDTTSNRFTAPATSSC